MSETVPANVEAVRRSAAAVPGVRRVGLVGSGAAGDRTALSDWDFELDVEEPAALDRLEAAMHEGPALAVFWDPLSTRANLIVLLDGPIKIDLIVADAPNPRPVSAWEVTAESLPRLDHHFWDWILWLGAKQLRGRTDLVRDELAKMRRALLVPTGAKHPVDNIGGALAAFLDARAARADELGVVLDDRLAHQVSEALVATGVVDEHDGSGGRRGRGDDVDP